MSELRKTGIEIVRRLQQSGYACYFAGGCVRDKLLGREPHDFDVVTSAKPEEVLSLFPTNSVSAGAHFGVVIVRQGDHNYDVATFRQDGVYLDARHPETVTFSDEEHDANRRDFTVNGLFEDPINERIIDYVGGMADLKAGVIRAIGDPACRFEEDALRLMRAIRFSCVLGFDIESATYEAIKGKADRLGSISVERIRDEFDKIMLSKNRRKGVQMLVETGLMRHIIPEVYALIGCEQPPQFHPEGDVYIHTMMMLDEIGESPSLNLALSCLLHDIGKPVTQKVDETGRIRFSGHDKAGANISRSILARLKYPNKTIDQVCHMVARHMGFINVKAMRESTLRRFMSPPDFADEMLLHRADCLSSFGNLDNLAFLEEKLNGLKDGPILPAPLLTGNDLIELGYEPGPGFKEILAKLLNGQIEGSITSREDALKAAAKLKRQIRGRKNG